MWICLCFCTTENPSIHKISSLSIISSWGSRKLGNSRKKNRIEIMRVEHIKIGREVYWKG